MDEDKGMNCGCSPMCENCAKGDHENCTTGMCTWKGKVSGGDADMGDDQPQ